MNMYAARCKLQIERRTVPGETEAQVVGEVQAIINRLAADPTFEATLKTLLVRAPFSVAPEAAIVKAVGQAASRVLSREPDYIGQPFWMDAALLSAAGVETVVIGPSGAGAHAREEWVDLQSLAHLALILAQTAIDYCQ